MGVLKSSSESSNFGRLDRSHEGHPGVRRRALQVAQGVAHGLRHRPVPKRASVVVEQRHSVELRSRVVIRDIDVLMQELELGAELVRSDRRGGRRGRS